MANQASRTALLAVDASGHAQNAAEYLARNARVLGIGEIIILNVHPVTSYRGYITSANEAEPDVGESCRQATNAARWALDRAQIACRMVTRSGEPAGTIADVAAEHEVDEIVMGSRGMSELAKWALGSVASKVIQRAGVPVTVIAAGSGEAKPAASSADVHRVLLAVDGSGNADRATDYLCTLGRSGLDLEVELLHVAKPIPAVCFESRAKADAYYREQCEAAVRDAKDALGCAGASLNVHIEAGDAADKIVQVAARRNCSQIVMGTRGLGGVAGLILGSVASKVLALAPMAVTLVK